jgi:hypothetical protein
VRISDFILKGNVPEPGKGWMARFAGKRLSGKVRYSLAYCVGVEWNIPAPETCDAIRNAATTAGTLMSLKN